MRIGALIFLFGIIANVVTTPRDINSHNYQGIQAANQANCQNHRLSYSPKHTPSMVMGFAGRLGSPNMAAYLGQDGVKRFITAEDSDPTDKSDSSDDQRGSGRIDV